VWAAPTVVVAYVVGRSLSLGPAAAGGALLVLAYGAVG
jgi:hypothetical protein